MSVIHGGDIYRNRVSLDFSVNINPLGMPESVRDALIRAVDNCSAYPDIMSSKLKEAVSAAIGVPKESLLFGNGASEIFMALTHALKPGKAVLPVPSFYGYEYVLRAAESDIRFYDLGEKENFKPGVEMWNTLNDDVDVLFLANPNNPTGEAMDREYIIKTLDICLEKNIRVILDECFIEFMGEEYSVIPKIHEYPNLVIVRAFTKIFAIPGVRLGYMVCSDEELLRKTSMQLPEWNISSFAQEAGTACAGEREFVKKTAAHVKKERERLRGELKKLGLKVFPSEADFILIYSDKPLYDMMLEKGILIRDCENFRGLKRGYYRIAVKNKEENTVLLKEMGECVERY